LDESLLPGESPFAFDTPLPEVESPAEEPLAFDTGGLGSGLGAVELAEAHAPGRPPRGRRR